MIGELFGVDVVASVLAVWVMVVWRDNADRFFLMVNEAAAFRKIGKEELIVDVGRRD